jgi:hypothetical protein
MKMKIRPTMALALILGSLPLSLPAADTNETAKKFDMSFPGGPPAALVRALEKASDTQVNAIIAPGVAELALPKMELRSVDVKAVFDAANILLRPQAAGQWVAVGNSSVWILLSAQSPSSRTQVHYVGQLLNKFKIDDITTAIQTAWQMGDKKVNAELKYHQDTQLLIALGTSGQLETMEAVIKQLTVALAAPASPPAELKPAASGNR